MKVDRRVFMKALAFAAGGTFGFMASPAPWHLIKDFARWTQNWPWVPNPAQGEPSVEKSICGMCDGGCGVSVRKVGSRLVQVAGNKEHPINRGLICPLGTAWLQMVYGPSRVRQPLRRTGTPDNPAWQPLTWEEALSELSGKIEKLRDAGESHTLACIANSSESTSNLLFERFLQAVGSRNFGKMNSGRDSRQVVLKLMQGMDGDLAYDLENAHCILSFGCALLEGWGSCGRIYSAYNKWFGGPEENRMELIQIESNLSPTAAKATQWIAIKPGTEAAVALGIAHVLIRGELYDKKFVDAHCFGFEDWTEPDGTRHKGFKSLVLSQYSPASVERITTVPAATVEDIAHKFAQQKPALAVAGRGRGERISSVYELMAVHSLNALMGNIGAEGGVMVKPAVPLASLPPVVMDEEASRGYAVERIDGAGGDKYPFSSSLPDHLEGDKIKVLLIHEANPYYALPDTETAHELFAKVPYIVSFTSYMDESAAGADLILPLPTRLERWDDLLAAPELYYPIYSLTRPVIEPRYDTRNAGDILLEAAKQLGGTVAESFPWKSVQDVMKLRTRGLYEAKRGFISLPGTTAIIEQGIVAPPEYSSFNAMWQEFVEHGCWYDPDYEFDKPVKLLDTPSGKFEFYSQNLAQAFQFDDDIKYLPHYEEPSTGEDGFDLLIMPEDMLLMANEGKGTPPFSIKQLDPKELKGSELFVRMNPITAMYHGLQEGDAIVLESPQGKVHVRLHLFKGIREGVVLVPLGFGHTAYDEFLRAKGVNANEILEARRDTITGLPLSWATPGRITKV